MLYLTMNQIKAHNPCTSGWSNLLKKAAENGLSYPKDGDIPISMNTLLDWCPVEDVIWAFRCNWGEGKELYVKFANGCAKRAKAAAYAADAAKAAANAANAADDAAYAAYVRERRLQKASLRALLRNHKG